MRSTALLLLLLSPLSLFASEVDVRPAPGWVERIGVDTSVAVDKANVRWGIYDLLSDHQIWTGDGSESQYWRTVRKVLSPSGVQNASELSLDFDPSFQLLTIHEVSIVRNGKRIDVLEPEAIRVIEKEDDAASGIYDGQRTAILFLKGVRTGDIIDFSWSIDGANPILGGRYTDNLDLSASFPSRRIRHRLLWPAGKPLQWRGADPSITVTGERQVYVWERGDVPAIDVEDSIPTWYEPWDSVQLTEFASWHEVAQWADSMFVLDERSRDEVKALAQRLSSEHETREASINAAIRFVQDDIRYLGLEMGRNSHIPHQPWETLDQRWGDCKDKTLLLVALLRTMGLEAYPALVSTTLRQRLEQKLPSPFLFDHVIAQVIDGGKTYWIDATISDQGGTLATIETPNDGRALVVRPDTVATSPVVTNQRGSTLVEQKYTTMDYRDAVVLEVKTTWTGADADAMRSELATMSVEDFASDRINRLALDQPKIEPRGLPEIHDDRDRNVIVVNETYQIPDLWAAGEWSWFPRVLESYLSRPETMIRSMPLAFSWPLDIEQRVTFVFPEEVQVDRSNSVTEDNAFRYEFSVDSNGKTISLRQTLHAKRDAVAVEEVPEHLTRLSAVSSEIGFRLSPPGARPQVAEGIPAEWRWVGGLVIVALFVGVSLRLATRKRPAPGVPVAPVLATPAFAPGDAPASAFSINSAHEMETALATRRCPCGAGNMSAADVQRARYAERDLMIVVRRCHGCGREQSTYFTAARTAV